MVQARTLARDELALDHRARGNALDLAAAMPRLTLAARRVAAAAAHGLHGRRRAGPGENFWQFRHFSSGEPAASVDWRRSARDDTLYVREREWEATHTIWLWIDRSRSMHYRSSLAQDAKLERGVVLGLALADLLVRGGERAGLLGLTRPTASRRVVDVLGERLALEPLPEQDAPPILPLPPLSEVVLFSDFLSPASDTEQAIQSLAARGARGHLVCISDPAEEDFPFTGRTDFVDPEAGTRYTAGRAQDLRRDYQVRLEAHREALRRAAARLGWSFATHRTDRPPSQVLLALHARLTERGAITGPTTGPNTGLGAA